MGDTDNGGGPDPNQNVKRARILVLLIPLVALLIAGGIALAGSNIFQNFQPQSQVGGVTTEAALARDIEREAEVLDVIDLEVVDGVVHIWVLDLQSGEVWSDRDSDAVTRAFDVLFEWAKENNYGVEIIFFSVTSVMGPDGIPVDALQGAAKFICPADLVAEYGRGGGNSDNIINQCLLLPDGLFVSPDAEVPFIGR